MTQVYKVIVEHDARGGYVATIPEFAGCQAQAKSLTALIVCIVEAIAPYTDAAPPAATREPGAPHRTARA